MLCEHTGALKPSPDLAQRGAGLVRISTSRKEEPPSGSALEHSWEPGQSRKHFLSRGQPRPISCQAVSPQPCTQFLSQTSKQGTANSNHRSRSILFVPLAPSRLQARGELKPVKNGAHLLQNKAGADHQELEQPSSCHCLLPPVSRGRLSVSSWIHVPVAEAWSSPWADAILDAVRGDPPRAVQQQCFGPLSRKRGCLRSSVAESSSGFAAL